MSNYGFAKNSLLNFENAINSTPPKNIKNEFYHFCNHVLWCINHNEWEANEKETKEVLIRIKKIEEFFINSKSNRKRR